MAGTLTVPELLPSLIVQYFNLVLSPAQVNTIVCAEQAFTVPANINLPAGTVILCSGPAINGAVALCTARRSSATQVTLTWVNPTAGNVTPTASQTYIILAIGPKA